MPLLSFGVQADYEQLIRMQNECRKSQETVVKLRKEYERLHSTPAKNRTPEVEAAIAAIDKAWAAEQRRLDALRASMGTLVDTAAKAGAEIERTLGKALQSAMQDGKKDGGKLDVNIGAKTAKDVAGLTRGLAELNDTMGTAGNQSASFSQRMEENASELECLNKGLVEATSKLLLYKKEMENALAFGDEKGYANAQEMVRKQADAVDLIARNIEQLQREQSTLSSNAGMPGGLRFYKSEADIKAVEEIKARLTALRQQVKDGEDQDRARRGYQFWGQRRISAVEAQNKARSVMSANEELATNGTMIDTTDVMHKIGDVLELQKQLRQSLSNGVTPQIKEALNNSQTELANLRAKMAEASAQNVKIMEARTAYNQAQAQLGKAQADEVDANRQMEYLRPKLPDDSVDVAATRAKYDETLEQLRAIEAEAAKTAEAMGKYGQSAAEAQQQARDAAIQAREKMEEYNNELRQNAGEDVLAKTRQELEDLGAAAESARAKASGLAIASEQVGIQDRLAARDESVSTATAPVLYSSDKDIEEVDKLRQAIEETKTRIQAVGREGGDTSALTQELTDLQTKLGDCEQAAMATAERMGPGLGQQAMEAQQKLYGLNEAATEQESVVSRLREQVETAKEAYEHLRDRSSDTTTATREVTEATQKAAETYSSLQQELQGAEAELANLHTKQQTAQQNWEALSGQVMLHNKVLLKLTHGSKNLDTIISYLPNTFKKAAGGLYGMIKAARAFILTPLGLVITAVALAVKALMSYFNGTAEGQRKFAYLSGLCTGALEQLKEVAIWVGKTLSQLFTDPLGSLKRFGQMLKDNVINRVQALGGMWMSVFKIMKAVLSGNWKGAVAEAKNGFNNALTVATGVKDVTGKVGRVASKIKARGELGQQRHDLDKDKSEWSVEREKKNTERERLRGTLMNSSLSKAKRKEAMAKIEKITHELTKKELEFADREVKLQERKMSLSSNTKEDNERLDELKRQRQAVKTGEARYMAMLARRSGSLNKGAKGGDRDAAQLEYESQKELEKQRREDEQQQWLNAWQAEANRIQSLQESAERDKLKISHDAEKQQYELNNALQATIDKLKDRDLQAWLKGGSNRKAYQWKQGRSDDQYRAEALARDDFERQRRQIELERDKALAEVQHTQLVAYRDFLRQAGTIRQQADAVDFDYAEKIANAKTDGEKLQLTGERDREKAALETKALMQDIDWYHVFDGIGNIISAPLEPLYQQLQQYVTTDRFRNAGAEDQQRVVQAMDDIRRQIGDNKSWRDLARAMTDYQKAMRQLSQAEAENAEVVAEQNRLLSRQSEMEAFQKELQQALASAIAEGASAEVVDGLKQQLQDVTGVLDTIGKNLRTFAKKAKSSADKVGKARANVDTQGVLLSQTAKSAAEPIGKLTKAFNEMGMREFGQFFGYIDQIKGAWNTLKAAKAAKENNAGESKENKGGKAAGELAAGAEGIGKVAGDKIGDSFAKGLEAAGAYGKIISAILGLLDMLKNGAGTLISNVIDTVLGAVSGILDEALSGKLVTKVAGSLISGVGNVFKSVFTLGGLFDWMGSESDKDLEKDTERLTQVNEALRYSIEQLTKTISEGAVADATTHYAEQKKFLEDAQANTQELMQRTARAYNRGFLGIGGSHSSNTKINDEMTSAEWARASKAAGRNIYNAASFFSLTSEEMAKVKKEAPDVYGKIKMYAAKGYKDASGYMDEYIGYYEQLDNLQKQLWQTLTTTSFDNVKSQFQSTLLDMQSSADDFANNFEQMMRQAVINSLMSETYNAALEQWYKDFASSMSDGNLAVGEQQRLKRQWDKLVNSAISERDQIVQAMGWDGSVTQQSSSRSLQGMTQDTAEAIEGRLTALQIAVESIRSSEAVSVASLAGVSNSMLEVMRQYNSFNVHYDNIERQMARVYLELQTISQNTGAVVKPILSMQSDIAEIRRNTKNI